MCETLVAGVAEKVPSSAELTEVIEEELIEPRRLWWSRVMSNMRPTNSVVEISWVRLHSLSYKIS